MRWIRNQDISIQLTKSPSHKMFSQNSQFFLPQSLLLPPTPSYILATSEIVSHFSVWHNKRRRSSLPHSRSEQRKNSALLSRHQSDWYVLLLLIRALAHTQKRASSFREILHGVEITAQLWSVDPCVQNPTTDIFAYYTGKIFCFEFHSTKYIVLLNFNYIKRFFKTIASRSFKCTWIVICLCELKWIFSSLITIIAAIRFF